MRAWTTVPSLQQLLDRQIKLLAERFNGGLLVDEIKGVLLTGSCSRGSATYRSDVDLLVILQAGPLKFSRVSALRDAIETAIPIETLSSPLRVEFHFVLGSVFETSEPAMREALAAAETLVDLDGNLRRSLDLMAERTNP